MKKSKREIKRVDRLAKRVQSHPKKREDKLICRQKIRLEDYL